MPNKTPIKAHRGMAHVPRPTRGGRRIGMPQPYRGVRSGRSMRAIRDIFNRRGRPPSGNRATPMPTQLIAEKPPASMPRGMATERPTAMREPSIIKQPVAQPVLSDAGDGRGTRRPPRPITPKRKPSRLTGRPSGRGGFGSRRMIGLPQRFRGGRRRSPFGINPIRAMRRRQQAASGMGGLSSDAFGQAMNAYQLGTAGQRAGASGIAGLGQQGYDMLTGQIGTLGGLGATGRGIQDRGFASQYQAATQMADEPFMRLQRGMQLLGGIAPYGASIRQGYGTQLGSQAGYQQPSSFFGGLAALSQLKDLFS